MQKKIYTIQDLREGKVAAVFEAKGKDSKKIGAPLLLKILKKAFPNDKHNERIEKGQTSVTNSFGFGHYTLYYFKTCNPYLTKEESNIWHVGRRPSRWDEGDYFPTQSIFDFDLDEEEKQQKKVVKTTSKKSKGNLPLKK